MITKLKLQIDLSNKMDIDDNGILIEEYHLFITVLDKDERFDCDNIVGKKLFYNGTGVFVIKTMWDEKIGGILYNGLLIPAMDRLGIQYKKTFKDDLERYYYLKQLYVAIEEWSNYWWGFEYDDKSSLKVKDNIWEVLCDTVYNGSMRYLSGAPSLLST